MKSSGKTIWRGRYPCPDALLRGRLRVWIEQLGNPYVYLDGGVVVKLSFADKGETIEDRINSLYLAGA